MRKMILDENKRSDGRTCDQIRAIDIEMSLLPRTHGSALFTRGETQSLAVCTLGGETMAQRGENLEANSTAVSICNTPSLPFLSEKWAAWDLLDAAKSATANSLNAPWR